MPQTFEQWKALPWNERVIALRLALGKNDRLLSLTKTSERLSKRLKPRVCTLTIGRWCRGAHKPQGANRDALTRLAREVFREGLA